MTVKPRQVPRDVWKTWLPAAARLTVETAARQTVFVCVAILLTLASAAMSRTFILGFCLWGCGELLCACAIAANNASEPKGRLGFLKQQRAINLLLAPLTCFPAAAFFAAYATVHAFAAPSLAAMSAPYSTALAVSLGVSIFVMAPLLGFSLVLALVGIPPITAFTLALEGLRLNLHVAIALSIAGGVMVFVSVAGAPIFFVVAPFYGALLYVMYRHIFLGEPPKVQVKAKAAMLASASAF